MGYLPRKLFFARFTGCICKLHGEGLLYTVSSMAEANSGDYTVPSSRGSRSEGLVYCKHAHGHSRDLIAIACVAPEINLIDGQEVEL